MTTLPLMARKKPEETATPRWAKDNAWVGVGLAAIGKDQRELCPILELSASAVSRLVAGHRAIKQHEIFKIKDFFRVNRYHVPQNGTVDDEDLTKGADTNTAGDTKGHKEGLPMGDGELTTFIKTLIEDNRYLRDRVQTLENAGIPKPKGRKSRP